MRQRRRARRSLYEVLGVAPSASEEEIRAAYHRMAREHHPDHNPDDPAAAERFREVKAAYDVLSDPARRQTYDRRRTGQAGPRGAESYPKTAAKEAGAQVIDHALSTGQSLAEGLLHFGFRKLRDKILGPR